MGKERVNKNSLDFLKANHERLLVLRNRDVALGYFGPQSQGLPGENLVLSRMYSEAISYRSVPDYLVKLDQDNPVSEREPRVIGAHEERSVRVNQGQRPRLDTGRAQQVNRTCEQSRVTDVSNRAQATTSMHPDFSVVDIDMGSEQHESPSLSDDDQQSDDDFMLAHLDSGDSRDFSHTVMAEATHHGYNSHTRAAMEQSEVYSDGSSMGTLIESQIRRGDFSYLSQVDNRIHSGQPSLSHTPQGME